MEAGGILKSWAPEEDTTIVALVQEHGIKKWSIVAAQVPGRNGKQCRERWHNQLDPAIRRGPWTFEEDQLLLQAHREHGSKWSIIAKCLPGRTDNSIKNRWNSALRRELRKMNRAAEVSAPSCLFTPMCSNALRD
ncbi:Homeodomain-like protein [Pavlovales sp. CCMP2436]|nr:Homeodomain-like protein [Pavlovales sp. CCMP2436]